MGIKDRRSNLKWGRYSRGVVLPAAIPKGKTSTLAADRIVILDPRGEISEDELLQFLEEEVEPRFWPWLKKRKQQRRSSGNKKG